MSYTIDDYPCCCMPTYHYHCDNCQYDFSLVMPMGSSDVPTCERCQEKSSVRKVIRPPMVHFKGGGFYATDSKKTAHDSPATSTPTSTPPSSTKESSQK